MAGNQFSRRDIFLRSIFSRSAREESSPKEPAYAPQPDEMPTVPPSAERILERIAAEPAYRLILPKLLEFCVAPRSGQEIHDKMLHFPEMRIALHTPEILLTWMVQSGAIAARQEHPDEENTAKQWQTTEAGMEALACSDPIERMNRLWEQYPDYTEIFRKVLDFCVSGRALPEIEYLLRIQPELENPKVYPSYLIDRLEFSGGLEWNGKWQTTEAGKTFLL